jgi:acyl-CoA dehydrogenase
MSRHPELHAAIDQLLTRECTPQVVRSAETVGFQKPLWTRLAAAGAPWIGLPESAGGSGGEFGELGEVITLCGRHAVPLPVSESGMLAGWLLAAASLIVPAEPITVAVPTDGDELRLKRVDERWVLDCTLANVPWARDCTEVVLIGRDGLGAQHVLRVPVEALDVTALTNLAGEPRDSIRGRAIALADDSVAPLPEDTDWAVRLLVRGSLARTLLTAGAVSRLCELTLRYTTQRQQFGRPISGFQAVQQLIAIMASESELAAVAGVAALDSYLAGDELGVAAARVAMNRAADTARTAAHQIHGAIGMTFEYDLQLYSRRISAWRHEFGAHRYWARRVAELAVADGVTWPAIAG